MTVKNALRSKEEHSSILPIITIDWTLFRRSLKTTKGTQSNSISEKKHIYVSNFDHFPGSNHPRFHPNAKAPTPYKTDSPFIWVGARAEGLNPSTCRNLMATLTWHFVDLNLSALFLFPNITKLQMTHPSDTTQWFLLLNLETLQSLITIFHNTVCQ